MGLDMYLTKEYYVKNWDHYEEDKRWHISACRGRDPRRVKIPNGQFSIPSSQISGITVEVAYWRKANQIHSWFVENCQDGVDECQKTHVEVEDLQKLLDVVTEVLKFPSPEKARELLEPTDGFFFGGTEIDDWYWEQLEETKEVLTQAIEQHKLEDEHGIWADFYYQSSW